MKNDINVGIGRRCINPKIPIGLAGYFNVRMWEKVLDDIEVRVIILKSGETFSAIIQYDLIAVPSGLWDGLVNKMTVINELKQDNIIVSATHSHTAPEVRSSRTGFNPDYIPFVVNKTIEAVKDAMNDLESWSIAHHC